MRAKTLAELLMQTPDAEVRAYDPDASGWYPVTGLTASHDTIQLYADSDDEAPATLSEYSGDKNVAPTKREFFDRAVKELSLDTTDPYTLLFANACALVDQRDALKRELADDRRRNEAHGLALRDILGAEDDEAIIDAAKRAVSSSTKQSPQQEKS